MRDHIHYTLPRTLEDSIVIGSNVFVNVFRQEREKKKDRLLIISDGDLLAGTVYRPRGASFSMGMAWLLSNLNL